MQSLNEQQLLGVTTTQGPVLILAGAGSGKTRVLTERVAYLIEHDKVDPAHIMAITFTNKAAGEMRDRVDRIVGPQARYVWVATFHSSCVRILRSHADCLGYRSGFSIYDTDDSKAAMKEVLKRLDIDSKKYPPKSFLNKISNAKNELQTPEMVAAFAGNDPVERQLARVYKAYQDRLLESNAFDFDDLIMQTVYLFKKHPDVLLAYQERFSYIMVDEYQDTNTAQFELVKLLAQAHHNLCVVGDDDQSIYKFRGANILNILHFEKHFPEACVIRLEQNYRSTKTVLNAANSVIKNNSGRKEKTLWTENPTGEKILLKQVDTAYDEAAYIAGDIASRVSQMEFSYNECAVLYRTNMQSRILEEKLLMQNIPYRIVGGVNFYARKEIKDILAYLKTIENAADDLAVIRIINVPKRGIGDTSIQRIAEFAAVNDMTFYDALLSLDEIPAVARAAGKIKPFVELIENLRDKKADLSVAELMKAVMEDSGYSDALTAEGTDDAKARLENLEELFNKAVSFGMEHPEGTLAEFLEEVALIADIDQTADDENRVLLMTLHSAKGLEFANVYLAGMEDGLFPGEMTIFSSDDAEMEEERRLCYVGITRAKNRLTLTSARTRMVRGETKSHSLSRFVEEIDEELLEADLCAPRFSGSFDRNTRSDAGVSRSSSSSFFTGGSHAVDYNKKFSEMTTGRQLEKVLPEYVEGDRVRHIKFGEGSVLQIEDSGRDYAVTVMFDTAGQKKLFASFARLEKLS